MTRMLQTTAILATLGIAAPASAATIFAIELDFGDVDLSSPLPLSDSVDFHSGFEGTNFYARRAFGSAGRGLLQVSSEASLQLTPAVTLGVGLVLNNTDAAATFVLDDVIVNGPGTSVSGALNLALDGAIHADAFAQLGQGVGSEASADASVSVFVSLAGTAFSGTQAVGRLWQVDTQSGNGSTFEDGLLTGFTGDNGIVTPFALLPVGTPFRVIVSLRTTASSESAHAIVGSRRQAEGVAQFAHTLSFAIAGPVFTLPEGYTVNSADGLISSNRWLGAPAQQPVPEPPIIVLVGGPLIGFALRIFRARAAG